MKDKLNRITGLSVIERQEAIRWYARQSEELRVKIMKKRFRIFLDLKSRRVDQDLSLIEYAALCIALKTEGYLAEKKYRSKKLLTSKETQGIEDRRLANAKSIAKSKGRGSVAVRLAKKWGVVVSLRRDGNSLQNICDYLKKHHQIKISRQYLHDIIKKWEQQI